MSKELAEGLAAAAEAAQAVAGAVPGVPGVVASIAALALRAGAGFAGAGREPIGEIARLLSAAPEVERVHTDWEVELERRFPDSSPTIPTRDPYEDL